MSFARCELPHPLFIVLTERCLTKAAEDYPGLPFPQDALEVENDFLRTAEHGVLALVDDKQPDNPRLSFCTPRYELVCALTQQKDAWYAIRMAPLGLRVHNQVARAALRIVPQTWGFASDLGELNRQLTGSEIPTGVNEILAAWKLTRGAPPAVASRLKGASSAELTFLANVDTLIGLACEVELEQAARQERIPVRVGEALSAAKWRFQLTGPGGLRVGEPVRAGSGDSVGNFDGTVVEAAGSSLVVRFFQPPESRQIQKIEWLTPRISTKQYAIQHEAVNALRNGQSLNPHLLGLIVENRFAAYSAPTAPNTPGRPNPAQKTMIERALLVPDLLLTLGPPGTGKTDTIRALVAREAALGRKVLVTSKNNKAVDNVLDGLESVHALRIGREEVVDPAVRPLLIDNRAAAMQSAILSNAGGVEQSLAAGLARWPEVQAALARLSDLTDDWTSAQITLEHELTHLAGWQSAAFTRVESALRRQENARARQRDRLDKLRAAADSLRGRVERLQRFSTLPLLGGLVTLLAQHFAGEWQAAADEYRRAALEIRKADDSIRRLWESYREFAASSEQALQFKQKIAAAEYVLTQAQADLLGEVEKLNELAQTIEDAPIFPLNSDGSLARSPLSSPLPPLPQDGGRGQGMGVALETLFTAWQTWHETRQRRQTLLAEWRDLLQTRPQALYPTLIRSADVVGATCIGVATDARFEDLSFDMVIADEAGQIQVMDLLVPLVRARRAVLVGDHLQLPPVVEPEIVQKIRENEPENQELGEWLEKSLFERLIERPNTPAANKIMLDTQYRMPRPIADFISTQFYGGNYKTGADRPHSDPFFPGSPLALVDTSREVRHYEQRAEDGQGYSNPTEARLLADLALAYRERGADVGVIVPYKRQAEVIRRELRRRQAAWSEDELTSRIATVDSFQGKEQDVILFGFTRSNAEGRIGFLAELRRLNVSLTRARCQLVLVGDTVTISNADDPAFAKLAKALLQSAKIIPSSALAQMLTIPQKSVSG